jgi:hypothetical protein
MNSVEIDTTHCAIVSGHGEDKLFLYVKLPSPYKSVSYYDTTIQLNLRQGYAADYARKVLGIEIVEVIQLK